MKKAIKENAVLYLGSLLIIIGIFTFLSKQQIIEFIINNSNTSNLLYMRKIVRSILLPFESVVAGILLLITGFLYKKREKVLEKITKEKAKKIFQITAIIIITTIIFISTFLLFFQRIEGMDEGFHLNNAKKVTNGEIPYIDFFYYKAPLFPYISAIPLFLTGFDLYGGRIASIILKIITLALVFIITKRVAKNKWPALIAVGLLAFHMTWHGQMVIIDTGSSIPVLLLLLSIFTLTTKMPDKYKAVLATIFLSLSVATRSFVAPAAFVLLYYFYMTKERWRNVAISFITGIACFVAIYVPFFVKDFGKTIFGITGLMFRTKTIAFEAQTNYILFNVEHGSLLSSIIDKGFNSLISIFHNFVIYILIFIAIIYFFHARKRKKTKEEKTIVTVMVMFLIISFFSILIPKPTGLAYMITFLPLGAIVAGWVIQRVSEKKTNSNHWVVLMGVIMLLLTISISLVEYPRFRLDYDSTGGLRVPIHEVKEVAKFVHENTPNGSELLTFEIPIAVEANRDVLPGFERGYFGFLLFDMNTTKHLGTVNPQRYIEYVTSKEPSAIIASQRKTWDVLNLYPPEVHEPMKDAINQNYYLAETFDQVTDWGKVEVYLPKESSLES